MPVAVADSDAEIEAKIKQLRDALIAAEEYLSGIPLSRNLVLEVVREALNS